MLLAGSLVLSALCPPPLARSSLWRPPLARSPLWRPPLARMDAGSGEGPLPPKALTRVLTSAQHLDALLEIYDEHSSSFNTVHVATFWHVAGRLTRRQGSGRDASKALRSLRHPSRLLTMRSLERAGERELSAIAWGVASAGIHARVWPELWRTLSARAMDQLQRELSSYEDLQPAGDVATNGWTTQGLANLA